MRWSIGTTAVISMMLGAMTFPSPAHAQQVEAAPLPPAALPPPQVAQSPRPHLATQDCVALPTPEQQTDCLNRVSSEGDYMPTPNPAPGSQMPMEYRLPLGTREIPQPR
ncbi:MAG: hypothetical protein JO128_24315 [Alphaproteobacteria bacterium]|nr:hypothetical protein [Alphaproteobacteria bacterium]